MYCDVYPAMPGGTVPKKHRSLPAFLVLVTISWHGNKLCWPPSLLPVV